MMGSDDHSAPMTRPPLTHGVTSVASSAGQVEARAASLPATGEGVGHVEGHEHDAAHAFDWPEGLRIAAVALAAAAVWFRLW